MYREPMWREVFSDRLKEVGDLVDEVQDPGVREELEAQWSLVRKCMFSTGR
jgi:hypothetical protein